jgi:hypothetical protein
MASAWLITRFIDATACFAFAPDRDSLPEGALPFDMFGVEFSHHDGGCTFETLCSIFKIRDPAIERVAAIVHDLDLKDGRFQAAEAAVTGTVIEGLQLAHTDDSELLRQGIALFEALYRSFERATRSARPRAVASRRKGQAAVARARKRK